jgi:hypothetical protein
MILSLAFWRFEPASEGKFQNGWMAPYSRGGVLKLAATSLSDGIVICCQGRCAS